jgi:hypothetical protein
MHGFLHQWTKYCNQPFVCVYQDYPPQALVGTRQHAMVGHSHQAWSDRLIAYLSRYHQPYDTIALYLEDYWLNAPVDNDMVGRGFHLMRKMPALHKVELTDDAHVRPHHGYDIHYLRVDNRAAYLTSTQAALWRVGFLLSCLREGENIWQFEIDGTARISGQPNLFILSGRQAAVSYANIRLRGSQAHRYETLSASDYADLAKKGCILQ